MHGPQILVRSLSKPRDDKFGNRWQYQPRSDHHSKIACWSIVFDLLCHCPFLRRHVEQNRVFFGINHEMVDFEHNRKKKLDLVLCTSPNPHGNPGAATLRSMREDWEIELTDTEAGLLAAMPDLMRAPVGSVLVALEAKACMTAHQKALPRLYDELNSSHLTVHGATEQAIAAGFGMVNIAPNFLSPILNKRNYPGELEWSKHKQPRAASITVEKLEKLPRRSKTSGTGYDAFAIVVVDCTNDGTPVELVETPPAPAAGSIFHYDTMIERLSNAYSTRFKDL